MISRFFLVLYLLTSFLVSAQKSSLTFEDFVLWKPIGNSDVPQSICNGNEWTGGIGRIESIWKNPKSSTIYVGANNGGLWKKQEGNDWQCLTNSLPVFGVRDILVSPIDTQKIYIATGIEIARGTNATNGEYGHGVYYSSNGGKTWINAIMNAKNRKEKFIQKLVIDPINPNHLYALSLTVLYESIDGGITWNTIRTPVIDNSYYQDIEIDLNIPNRLYLTSLVGDFFYSEDGGKTWDRNTSLSNQPIVNLELMVNNKSLYAIYCHSYSTRRCSLKKSKDGGKTWEILVQNQFLWTAKYTPFILKASPNDTSRLYVGAIKNYVYQNNRFLQSGDRRISSTNYLHDDIRSIEVQDSAGVDIVYVGTDGGISKSNQQGNNNTWEHIGGGLQLGAYYSIASNNELLVGGVHDGSNNIFYNQKWENTSCISGDGGSVLADIHNTNQVYVFSNSIVYKGTYKNKQWSFQRTKFPSLIEYDSPLLQHPTEDIIYAGEWHVKVSYDQGNTCGHLTTLGQGRVTKMAISESNSHVFYYSRVHAFADRTQDTSFLYRRSDDGKEWQDISASLGNVLIGHRITGIKIHPKHSNMVWITLNGFQQGSKVYETNDGGKTWQNISFNLDNFPVQCIQYVDNNICVGTDKGVFYKTIKDTLWRNLGHLPSMTITSITLNKNKKIKTLYLSSYGRGVWKAELPHISLRKRAITKDECWIDSQVLSDRILLTKGKLVIDAYTICLPFSKIKLAPYTELIITEQGNLKNAKIIASPTSKITVKKGGKLDFRKKNLHKDAILIYE